MKKVLLTLILTLCIVLGVGVIGMQADWESGDEEPWEPYTGWEDDDSFDTNVTYTLDTETGVLTISGTGDMEDYRGYYPDTEWVDGYRYAPWYASRKYIKTVVILDGVTSIGQDAFNKCYNLSNVIISDSVTRIKRGAFSYCESLTSIDISNGVTNIEDSTFVGCSGLLSITVPNNVTNIEMGAFDGCSNLKEIIVDESNAYYSTLDGVLFNKLKTILVRYPEGKKGSYIIPNSVKSIGNYAFYDCSNLTNITIPDSVTSIGWDAFYNCSSLTSVIIPDSVVSIEDWAFDECDSLSLALYEGTKTDWQNVSIGEENDCLLNVIAYGKGTCGRGVTWEVDASTGTLTISGEGTMDNYSLTSPAPWSGVRQYITSVVVEKAATSIGSYAFYNLGYLKNITIPKSITDIEQYAFEGCEKLKYAYYTGSEDDWDEIAISRAGNENLTIYTTVIYDSEIEDEPTIPDTEGKTPEIGKTTFTFTPVGVSEGDIIAVLVIKDGVSTSYAKTYSGSGTVTFEIEDGFNSIKILVWDSYESMEPLMEEYATIE